jgi:hypothetical protein
VAALVELRRRQAHESEVAGPAYGAGLADLDWYTEGDKYVVAGLGMFPGRASRRDGGTVPAGLWARIVQRLLAFNAAIWLNGMDAAGVLPSFAEIACHDVWRPTTATRAWPGTLPEALRSHDQNKWHWGHAGTTSSDPRVYGGHARVIRGSRAAATRRLIILFPDFPIRESACHYLACYSADRKLSAQ